ncbi:bleomycin hydrolase [Centruroides vittatus]|uniref:bleomycin hydrolase n=1 Tax=Centruroides vittatus TaxID=120091 RepID=UPI00350FF03D
MLRFGGTIRTYSNLFLTVKKMSFALTPERLNQFQKSFESDPKNLLALNACTKHDPFELCLNRLNLQQVSHVFSHKVDIDAKPVTNQKSSGRCWIFACLNVIRIPFMKHYELEEFEFSQAHLFFWDKIERSNYFLNAIVETARRGEPVDGRLVSFLLSDPSCDGGQWDMLVNLILRYGLIPKKCFPESYSCENSGKLNRLLKSKLREYARDLRVLVDNQASEEEIHKTISQQMDEVYRITAICLGIPPQTFTWEYYNKNKSYFSIGPLTPVKFYEDYVKPYFNIEDKVCIVNDPRPVNSYGKSYTVDCLGNMVGGRLTMYNNQPIETLIELATESIQNKEAVWFGSEVSQRLALKVGLEDMVTHNFKLVFGVDINEKLNKAERLLYGESQMTHAMVITGMSLNSEGKPIKWRVENSWGDDKGEKGNLVMSTDWFKEFVFEVVVDKKYVSEEIMAVFKQKPIILPAWDPMGSLARS